MEASFPELAGLIALMLLVGAFAGLVGGLFGIGGGIIIVPALYTVFGFLGVEDAVRIKVAVGTSLATIIITSLRSVRTHRKHGAVDMELLKAWAPWIGAGAICGAVLARFVSAGFLTVFFALCLLALSIHKGFFKVREKPAGTAHVPGGIIRVSLASGVGLASSLMGIGGGVMGVVILTGFGRSIHQAIGTAAGFGLAIAVPGAVGFALSGLGQAGLPPVSVGFVNLPAFACIAGMSFLTAPLGANLAHRLDKGLLNRIFAGYMALTALLLLADTL